ncbi:MAG: DUF58 domain-containing protein, partial [Myxococcota bacterium]
MLHPTFRTLALVGGTAIVALLPALVDERTWPLWVACLGLVGFVVGLDAMLVPSTKDVRLSVSWPSRLFVGRPHTTELELHGLTDPDAAMVLEHSREATSGTATPTVGVDALQFIAELRPGHRGVLKLQQVWVRHGGPFGFVQRVITLPLDVELPIVPDLPRVQADALKFFGGRTSQTGLKVKRFAGDGSEFDALREFMPGMDRRTIDWKASARHTKLLAREFRAERNHQIVLAIDTGRLMAEP